MLIIYRIITNIILILSPVILIYRLLIKKEDSIRFKEKFCFFSKIRKKGTLIWFHGASVGEIQSIIPLLEIYEKNDNVKQILITSNTLSSSRIIKDLKLKKVTHQFYPIDLNFFTKKFINYWKPSIVFFIDSEIWPNMLLNLKKNLIPVTLLNARITKKTFKRWIFFYNFAKKIFNIFDLCLACNSETKIFLKKLGSKNIKYVGNLKYSQSEKKLDEIDVRLKKFIKNKKIWCASSTHYNEEIVCGTIHKRIKKKHKNFLTIIIPRHVNRVKSISEDLRKLDLKVHIENPISKIHKNTDIYLVNSYGKTKSFYNNCKNVFLGGSLVNHGGQNPLEAARFGCNVLHGSNIYNFKEIYRFLEKNKISFVSKNEKELHKKLTSFLFKKGNQTNNAQNKIKSIGKKILNNTIKEINFFFRL